MRRPTTMMASASAAVLAALAVTIAVPAIADDRQRAAKPDRFGDCLRDHGLDGAPDGAALKPWLRERLERGDTISERALDGCSEMPASIKTRSAELRACLAAHGIDVPGDDPAALRQWLAEHVVDATYRDEMTACGIAPIAKPGTGMTGDGAP